MKKKLKLKPKTRRRLSLAALIASFLLMVVMANAVIYALAYEYNVYTYTEKRQEHTIGTGTEAVFADVPKDARVRILFCMGEDALKIDAYCQSVLRTARQLEQKYSFISVDFTNIYLDPDSVSDYRGPEGIDAIQETTVIVESNLGTDTYVTQDMKGFFRYENANNDTPIAYVGEQMFAYLIGSVVHSNRPTVYFTTQHGESSTLALGNLFGLGGYTVKTIDLTLESIPEDATMLVISNPTYDFSKGAEGSGIIAEIEKLESYLARGGNLTVFFDGAEVSLPNFENFLAEYGVICEKATLRDFSTSITPDGYALATAYGTSAHAALMKARTEPYDSFGSVMARAARITERDVEGVSVEPLLFVTGESERDGEIVSEQGEYPVVTLSTKGEGQILLFSGVRFADSGYIYSNRYSNADFLYAAIELMDETASSMPIGCTEMPYVTTAIEGLTMGQARTFLILGAVVLPLLILAFGVAVGLRRKFR
ncbi:MAG: Gldg family protein [Clostridia bacterium]|nr:Gldg family protein [Clostridia bacterium]